MLALHRTWVRFRKLSPTERRDALTALVLSAAFSLRLRVIGLPVLRRVAVDPGETFTEHQLDEARALAHLVNAVVLRTLGADQCLVRSLVLQSMLSRKGLRSQLRIGVRRAGASISAHAWVECAGVPVNDELAFTSQYAALDGLATVKGLGLR
jgi:hypothetical protein